MEIKRETRLYSLVIIDPANHCSHRCGYCYNIWGDEHCMEMEAFQKMIQILPYTKDGGFLMSCLYEPTLNPQFFEMAAQIPRQFKNKVCVTTNLDGHYSDEDLSKLAQSNMHHVEVSLPSFEEARYREITGSQGGACLENLFRLRRAIDQNANRTRLQLNTMVLKSNLEEIPKLVKRAHEELRPYAHILNTPQMFEEGENVLLRGKKDNAGIEKELLSREELNCLKDELDDLGYKNLVYGLQHDAESHAEKKAGRQTPPAAHDAYSIYLSSNGQGFFMKDENPFDLADIEYPFVFFSKALMARQANQAAASEVQAPPETHDRSEDPDYHAVLDAITIWDERFVQLRGWAFHRQVPCGPLFILVRANGAQVAYRAEGFPRADVAALFEDDEHTEIGFDCLIDPRVLPYEQGQNYEVHVGVLHEGALYTKQLTVLSF